MIVEDEAIIYEETKSSLERIGYEIVASAQTGEEAIGKAKTFLPEIILMDIKLKGEMDGIEAAAIIRSHYDIPIIYLTAFAEEKRVERAKLTSPYAYLLKPIQNRDLYIAIEMALHTAKTNAEQKRVENELARQKLELQTILDSVPAMVFYKDKNDRFLNVNQFLVKSFGIPREEIIGKTAIELSPVEDKSYHDDDRQVIQTGKSKTEIIEPFKTADGIRWAQTDKIPFRDEKGEIKGVIGFSLDITKRVQTANALKRSEKYFQQLVESLTVGILVIKNDQIIFQNPECKKIVKELQNQNLSEFYETIFYEDRELVKKTFGVLTSGESKTADFQFRLFDQVEGESEIAKKWVQSLASMIKYEDEEAILVNLLDITKTHELEKQINIQDKMSSLGRISAGIAHEIRNPLSGINTYLYSLQNIIDQEKEDKKKRRMQSSGSYRNVDKDW